MFYGPTRVDEALRWYEAQEAQHPIALTQQAMLEAMRGQLRPRRGRWLGSADAIAEEFGPEALCSPRAGWHCGRSRCSQATRPLPRRRSGASCELLEELGEVGYRSMAVSQLAASLYALERLDEAEEWTRAAEELAPSDDIASQMLWRQVRAQVLARRGEHERRPSSSPAKRSPSRGKRTCSTGTATRSPTWPRSTRSPGVPRKPREQLKQALALYERKGQRRGWGESTPTGSRSYTRQRPLRPSNAALHGVSIGRAAESKWGGRMANGRDDQVATSRRSRPQG